jgi:hypothetical protein
MNIIEAVRTLMERPGHIAVILETGRMFELSKRGRAVLPGKNTEYFHFSSAELCCMTWECWTPRQLETLVTQAPAAGE